MKNILKDIHTRCAFLKPYLPYGVLEPWDDLDPRLYHAIHIYWLKFYGMWYYNFIPTNFYFWLHLLYTMVVLSLVCVLPCIGEVVYLLRRGENIGDIAEGLYLFLSEMYTYFKIAVFWLNKGKILNLLKFLHCEEFKPVEKEHRVILRKSIKTARFVMTYYSAMCVGAVSVAIILPLTENFDMLPTNVEYPYFDVNKSPVFAIIYLHHIYYKPATCIIDGVMDTILAAFIASAIGQIEVLAYNLRNFKVLAERKRKRNEPKDIDMQGLCIEDVKYTQHFHIHSVLKKNIIHYNAIIQYVSMIEGAFSLASALQFMLSVMVLCLVGIQFLYVPTFVMIGVVYRSIPDEVKMIENPSSHPMQIVWMAIYLTCMLIEVFILCWFGNELILKSLELRQAAFEGPWLETDPKTTMFIIILLERCKRPLRVTAGKIFTLSLDTYTKLINWSYKAFAVMTNMNK